MKFVSNLITPFNILFNVKKKIYDNNLKNSLNLNNYHTSLSSYLKKFFKSGLKLKFFNFFFKIFFILIYKLNCLKSENNINFLFNNLTYNFSFFFFYNFYRLKKSKTKRKKIKQKFMPKFILKNYYLKKINRHKIIFKLFILKLNSLEGPNYLKKLFKLCIDTFLDFKNSWLYFFRLNFFNFYLKK